jgi:parallel beta-helix repeat protein
MTPEETHNRIGTAVATTLLLTAIIVALLTVTGTAAAQTEINNIDSCTTINESNSPSDGLVNLTSDIQNGVDDCIRINTSDITLDGMGHTVEEGKDVEFSTAFWVRNLSETTPENVTVRNATLSDWGIPVLFEANNGTVEDLTVLDSEDDGISVWADNNLIKDTRVSGGGATGIDFTSGGGSNTMENITVSGYNVGVSSRNGNAILNSTVKNNAEAGYEVTGSDESTGQNLTIGGGSTAATVSFTAKSIQMRAEPSPPSTPVGQNAMGQYLNLTQTGFFFDSGYANLTFEYSDSEVSGIDESALSVWENDGVDWSELDGGTDTDKNRVQGNVTLTTGIDESAHRTAAPLATAGTSISSCTDITSSGLYKLNDSITGSSASSCIDISADDVILNGQNNTIGGDGTGDGVGINVTGVATVSNVTVQNVVVEDWNVGIVYEDATNSRLSSSLVNGAGDTGIRLVSVTRSNITRNAVKDTLTHVEIGGSDGNLVAHNSLTGTGTSVYGIFLSSSSNNDILDNTVRDHSNDGILFTLGGGQNNVVSDNAVVNAGRNGVFLNSGSSNMVTGNTVKHADNTGLKVSGSDDSLFMNNTVTGSGSWAFSSQNAANTTVKKLDIGNSTAPDTTVDFGVKNALLRGVRSSPPTPNGEQDIDRYINATEAPGSSYLNLTFRYADDDVTAINETKLDVWKNNGTWNEVGGTVDTDANQASYNATSFSTFAPLAPTQGDGPGLDVIDSCQTIDSRNAPADGTVVLGSNITDTPVSSCVNITVSDITFDGQGHVIDSDGSSGIRTAITVAKDDFSALNNVTVKNVSLTDWEDSGVEYNNVSDGRVEDVTVEGADGVSLGFGSKRNTVVGNRFIGGNDYIISVSVRDANNSIKDNLIKNGSRSITVDGSDNLFVNNTITDSSLDAIRVSGEGGRGEGNRFVNNTVRNTSRDAFVVEDGNVVEVENLDIGSSTARNTTVDFRASDVAVNPTNSPPSDTGNLTNISRYFTATNRSADPFLDVSLQYDDGDVGTLNESDLGLYRYNQTVGEWEFVQTSVVNQAQNEVTANVTEFSTFGAFEGTETGNVFTKPVVDHPEFVGPPQNTKELHPELYEDLSGDGDGKSVRQTVTVFGELIRGNDLGLSDEQAKKFNWNEDSPDTKVTVADMVSLFGEQIRAD